MYELYNIEIEETIGQEFDCLMTELTVEEFEELLGL